MPRITLTNKSVPNSVEDAKQEYLDETDTVKHFIWDNLDKTGNGKARIKPMDLYNTFKPLTNDNMGSREFHKSFERHGLKQVKMNDSQYYRGIKYKQVKPIDCDTD